jgi:hypothetical protein
MASERVELTGNLAGESVGDGGGEGLGNGHGGVDEREVEVECMLRPGSTPLLQG